MKRKMIRINEELCNGCGECVVGCSEGALKIIDGKAKLVSETFCDGFGDCVGTCPTGALEVTETDAKLFNLDAVKDNLLKNHGKEAVWRLEEAQNRHAAKEKPEQSFSAHHSGGCPGSRAMELKVDKTEASPSDLNHNLKSELTHWPIQIHLVNPTAPFFNNKELVIMSTCAPLAFADSHNHYLKGRSVVVGCPKLDNTTDYPKKLGEIMRNNDIPKVIIPRMQVPCCFGLTKIAMEARTNSGKPNIVLQEDIISVEGKLVESRLL